MSDLPSEQELWNQIRAIIQQVMMHHALDTALQAAEYKMELGLGVDLDRVNVQLLEFTRNYANEWWPRWSEPTQAALRETIATWEQGGLDKKGFEGLVDALGEVFFDTMPNGSLKPDTVRARRIAVTETTRIFDEGNRIAEVSAGIEQQEFLTARDDVVCTRPIVFNGIEYAGCQALDGLIFPINEGPKPGKDTHPNCRCQRSGISKLGKVLVG